MPQRPFETLDLVAYRLTQHRLTLHQPLTVLIQYRQPHGQVKPVQEVRGHWTHLQLELPKRVVAIREKRDLLVPLQTLRVLRRCLDSAKVNPRCSMRWCFLLRVIISVTVSSSLSSLHMTSCSLTRIEGLLRVRVAGEGNGPFYRTFATSPNISLLSKSIIPNASRRSTIPITPSLPPSIRGLPPCSRMPRDVVQEPDAWHHLRAPYFPQTWPKHQLPGCGNYRILLRGNTPNLAAFSLAISERFTTAPGPI